MCGMFHSMIFVIIFSWSRCYRFLVDVKIDFVRASFRKLSTLSGILLCCEVAIGLVTKLPHDILYGIELSGDDLVTTSLATVLSGDDQIGEVFVW